jgi:predicted DsbA family dithiol-disulfide isomerase
VKEVLKKYDGKVRLVVKFAPYPYRDGAKMAAQAALAAKEQGAFEAMHEKMLENYYQLTAATLKKMAGELKLDTARFEKDMFSERIVKKVEEDIALTRGLEIWQTPTFVINGRQMVGERPLEHFVQVIDEELKALKK